ncbi:ABC transporter substrate-binding protein [Bradyrhizobium sp. CCGUVB23]|uniref:ABC transporter substrate-binding protein n=1 Tax=Bradyrhizobium sp. CCGUVB23 TaxID=2949630 RepID=UPI0020B2D436|nr:ABC transporter substrate-binding protein [Bradyrhizobium sp. CCGUVB23]MCP3460078.1 ABC transporter substrate-binding protein [Bradyrhizobium sp. CCGUVB23]
MTRAQRKARKSHYGLRLLAGLFVACAVAYVLFGPKPTRSQAPTPKASFAEYTVKLSTPLSVSAAGMIIAASDGLFAQAGLRVRLVAGLDDDDAIAAVVADENTIGIASTAGFLKARSGGLPIVAFAGFYAVNPAEFYTLPEAKLLTPLDLEGKRIGYTPNSEFVAILNDFVSSNSLAQSRLFLMESNTPLQDLLDRKVDVLLGRRDVDGLELERLNIEYKILRPDAFGVHNPGPVFFAQERIFAQPNRLEKFLMATAGGWSAAYADLSRTVPIIANSVGTPLPTSLVSRLMDSQRSLLRPFGARFGEMDSIRIRTLQSQLLQRRAIQHPVDLTRAINYDIVKETYRHEATNLNRVEP